MCGIFGLFNHETIYYDKNKEKGTLKEFILKSFNLSSHRGPDNSTLLFDKVSHSCLGFHRLTINGSNNYYSSNQPLCKNGIILLCNGEIYNYTTLLNEIGLTNTEKEKHTGSDCEIIIDLYLKYGIETTLELLDGVFAFILIDMRCLNENNTSEINNPLIFIARDPFGLRPLYWLKHNNDFNDGYIPELIGTCLPFGFASEMKQLAPIYNYIKTSIFHNNETNIGDRLKEALEIIPFPPGHYACYNGKLLKNTHAYLQKDTKTFDNNVAWFIQQSSVSLNKYYTFPHFRQAEHINITNAVEKIQKYLCNAVEKRVNCTDRPIACLLSGGVDSSLICGIVKKFLPENTPLETYSIGMNGSSDEKYVKCVSEHIQSIHTHVECSKTEFLEAIPTVIRLLETYDTTTVRASVGNYLIGKYISENSDAKVIFNGDGSDELFGGYKYFLNCPNKYEFNKERKRLLTDIHYFDVLRSERSISVNGLESRTPFLDKELVSYVMTLVNDLTFTYEHCAKDETPIKNINNNQVKSCVFEAMKHTGVEKWMLRRAFINSNIIPKNILFRSKEAFSDGVSSEEDSWYYIIQKHLIEMICANHILNENGDLLIPLSVFIGENCDNFKTRDEDEYSQYISINSLRYNNLYDRMVLCYNFLINKNDMDKDIDFTDKMANETMLEIEKWYYKSVYEYFYGSIKTIPYYWMPKYSSETNDPSARTLNIYKTKDLDESDQYMKINLQNINTIDITNIRC